MKLNEYLTEKAAFNTTILSAFSFMAGTTVTEITNMLRLKYGLARMYYTTESDVLTAVTTVLTMYSDQLTKLYTSYNKVYDPETGYTKTIETNETHSGSDTDDDEVTNSGSDTVSSSGSSTNDTTLNTRTYDDNTMTETENTEGSTTDSNTTTNTHGHIVNTDHTKSYGHIIDGEVTETGTLPVTEALKSYVEFARFNFYEYVIDIVARYITIPSYDMRGEYYD